MLTHTAFRVPLPRSDDDLGEDPQRHTDRELLAIRAWARSRGYPIDEGSGVPLTVLRTYRRLHPS